MQHTFVFFALCVYIRLRFFILFLLFFYVSTYIKLHMPYNNKNIRSIKINENI